MTIKQNLIKILPLAIILCGLLTYSFMQAQWTGPTADAPDNNTEAPINVSGNYQAKIGDLGAIRMRAGAYCNANGTVCVTDLQKRIISSCPVGQAIRAINADGSVTCQSSTSTNTPAPTCITQSTAASGCYYGSGSPACPAGSTQSGPSYRGGRCSTNNDTWITPCIKTVCS